MCTESITRFLDDLAQFIEREHEEGKADVRRRCSGPIAEREDRGDAIAHVTVADVERTPEGYRIWLSFPKNDSRFRDGDCVKITRDAPLEPDVLADGRITRITDTEAELVSEKCDLKPGSVRLTIDASSMDMRKFYDPALERAAKEANGRDRIVPLLMGDLEPSTASAEDLVDERGLRSDLNPKQRSAVIHAGAADPCYLIQGPPGTGKTKVLSALVQRILAQTPQAAIFVTSFTHRAIDNALERLLKDDVAPGRVAKVAAMRPKDGIPHAFKARELRFVNTPGPMVIGATPFALKNRVGSIEFDWVIVDEASQMTLPLAVMAMLAGRRWVFFGDEQQMPPVVLSMEAKDAINASVFGVLKRGGYNTMLTETYRLPAPLSAWPSKTFYRNQLVSALSVRDRRLSLPSVPEGYESILSPEPAAVFVRIQHSGCTSWSADEVVAIVRIIQAVHGAGLALKEVGVVVPYRRQARLLRNALQETGIAESQLNELVADTVERMQGQERDVIIVSLTTSEADFARKLADFLFQPQRLNVAITRPKAKLIIVGSDAWVSRFPNEIPEAGLFAEFLSGCARGVID